MARAGVSESVLLTYVRTSSTPFGISARDVMTLKDDGVPQSVITEALQRDAQLRSSVFSGGGAVTESQLFRMRFGYIFYGGKLYSLVGGLSPDLRSVLATDPATSGFIRSYSHQRTASGILSWGGLAFVLGGSIYGIVAASQESTNTDLNAGITMGVVGTGVLSLIIGAFTHVGAYQSLYDGLAQYNEDLIASGPEEMSR